MDFPVGHRHCDDRGQRECEHGKVTESFWRPLALNPLRRLRQNLAATEPGQAVKRMDVRELPVPEVGGGKFDQVSAQRREGARRRPAAPGQAGGFRRFALAMAAHHPSREQGARRDAHQDRKLDGYVDPQTKTAGHAREDEPAARRLSVVVRRGRGPDSGREQQHAAQGQNLRQAAVVGRGRKKSRGERKDGDQADGNQGRRKNAEAPRDQEGGAEQEQQVQDRIRHERGAFHRQRGRPARENVIAPRDRAEPPAIGRRGMHRAAERRIFVVDVAHPPFPAVEHALGLREPMITFRELLGDNQSVARCQLGRDWRGGRDRDRRIRVPATERGHVFNVPDAKGVYPEEKSRRRAEHRQPGEGGNAGRFDHGDRGSGGILGRAGAIAPRIIA